VVAVLELAHHYLRRPRQKNLELPVLERLPVLYFRHHFLLDLPYPLALGLQVHLAVVEASERLSQPSF
jgi:hypothetical protein